MTRVGLGSRRAPSGELELLTRSNWHAVFWADGARHPLLLQPALPRLPPRPEHFDLDFESQYTGRSASALLQMLEGRPVQGPTSGSYIPPPTSLAMAQGAGDSLDPALLPRPIDLRVPKGKRVVAITGPNTGGKTAALKALGILVVMARAGMYLPVHQQLEVCARDLACLGAGGTPT